MHAYGGKNDSTIQLKSPLKGKETWVEAVVRYSFIRTIFGANQVEPCLRSHFVRIQKRNRELCISRSIFTEFGLLLIYFVPVVSLVGITTPQATCA
jgi:hypothetical protein